MTNAHYNLTAMRQAGVLAPVDVNLAALLERVTGDAPAEALLAAALACQWPQRGHVCVDLQQLSADDLRPAEDTATPNRFELPDRAAWLQVLQESAFIGPPDVVKPVVLWQDRWLYLRRCWQDETRLADRIRHGLRAGAADADAAALRDLTARIFGVDVMDPEDKQQQASLLAAMHPVFVLTGGPGTGKTTTILRLLAVLLESYPTLSVALAAPTGKAALRLQDSLAQGLEALPSGPEVKKRIPTAAQTLHRLLGYQRRRAGFRHDEKHPLPYDVVVVDEASMMDLSLTAKLLAALPKRCRLILVGDREQLPSVEAGTVFADLCAAESPVPRVELTKNYRFSSATGIGGLASAIRHGDAGRSLDLLASSASEACSLQDLPPPHQLKEALWQRLQDFLTSLQSSSEPDETFAAFERLRVLCAHRTGPFGAQAVNQAIHELLVTRLRVDRELRWYPGRPVLITENDYAAELFNGDTGLVLPWRGKLHVFMRDGAGEFRKLPPARLPAHESAYAMTVHKSQGSEFDEVILLLTDRPSRLLTRELLYTGVTRARSRVEVWGPQASLSACVTTPLQRTSGLRARFETWKDEDS